MACKLAVQLRDGLFESDAALVEKAFGDYLNQYPYDTHIEDEKFYQAMLESVMLLADQGFQTQEPTTHGRLDLHLTSKSGDEYIVEIKLYREEKPKNNKPLVPPIDEEAIAELRGKMTPLAMDTFKQITERYQGKFAPVQGRVVKVALVIARRSFVLAMFEAVG
jgi:hypothetical protein